MKSGGNERRRANKWGLLWERGARDIVRHNSVKARSVKVDLWYLASVFGTAVRTACLWSVRAYDASAKSALKQIVAFFWSRARPVYQPSASRSVLTGLAEIFTRAANISRHRKSGALHIGVGWNELLCVDFRWILGHASRLCGINECFVGASLWRGFRRTDLWVWGLLLFLYWVWLEIT